MCKSILHADGMITTRTFNCESLSYYLIQPPNIVFLAHANISTSLVSESECKDGSHSPGRDTRHEGPQIALCNGWLESSCFRSLVRLLAYNAASSKTVPALSQVAIDTQ